jgi:hypothetical protein
VVFLLLAACTSSAPPVIYGTTQQLTVGSVRLTIERLFLSRDPASRAVAKSAPKLPRGVANSTCRLASTPCGREIDIELVPRGRATALSIRVPAPGAVGIEAVPRTEVGKGPDGDLGRMAALALLRLKDKRSQTGTHRG